MPVSAEGRVENQKLNQTAALLSFGWVFGFQFDSLEKNVFSLAGFTFTLGDKDKPVENQLWRILKHFPSVIKDFQDFSKAGLRFKIERVETAQENISFKVPKILRAARP